MNRNETERLYGAMEAGRAGAPLYLAPPYQDADEDAEEAKLPLAQYFWILRRYRWRILGAVAAAVLATLVLSERLTPIYESTATVDIDRQSPAGVVGDEATRSALNDADQFMATQIKLVESDAVLRPVDEQFQLRQQEGQPAALSPREEAAPVTLQQLKVTRPPNTYLMQIGYRSADPQLAADAANAITQSYLEHSYEIRLRSSAGVARFMERQIEELKAKMERSSRALNEFERELNVINPEEKTNILSARLLQLNTEFTNAQSERLKREAEYQSVSGGSLEAALAAPQGGRPDMAPFRFAAAILSGQAIEVYNYGRMWRDFTYIDDIAEGVLRIAARDPAGCRLFNVANSRPVGLMEFIGKLEGALGRRARKRFLPAQPGDAIATHADVEDFWQAAGFRPSTPLAVGIERFARWYQEYFGEVIHEHGDTRAHFDHARRARVFHAP